MKNINIVINVILFIAISTLFALHFSGSKNIPEKENTRNPIIPGESVRIAYFNADSLTINYELFKDEKIKMDSKMREAENKFAIRQKEFEKEAAEFQQRSQYLTITEKENREKKLYGKQQELMMMEQTLSNELAKSESDVNNRIIAEVEDFLKKYAGENKLNYILSYKRGANVWFADPKLDITKDILEKLNNSYRMKKAGK